MYEYRPHTLTMSDALSQQSTWPLDCFRNNRRRYSEVTRPTPPSIGRQISNEAPSVYDSGRRRSIEDSELEKIRLLYVDDDSVSRMVAKTVLQRAGYVHIDITESGPLALQKLEEKEYDLLLVDICMPEMDGIELLQKIRNSKNQSIQNIAIVMVSASDQLDSVYRCLSVGADDFICKPVTVDKLGPLWRNVVRRRRVQMVTKSLSEVQSANENLLTRLKEMSRCIDEMTTTPISAIVNTVSNIQATSSLTPEVKQALSSVIQALSSVDLYKPAFGKVISELNYEPELRDWLMNELEIDNNQEPENWTAITEEEDIRSSLPSPLPSSSGEESSEADSSHVDPDCVFHAANINCFEFNAWSLSTEELLDCAVHIFSQFGLPETFQIDRYKLRAFLHTLRRHYKANPYHNFRHAVDVLQFTYAILTVGNAMECLSRLEILGLLIAAIGHDVGHPGLNNTFLIETGHTLAITYNDISVLENFHGNQLFLILRNEECNILDNLERGQYQQLRRQVLQCILATDMSLHMDLLGKINSIHPVFSPDTNEHRLLLCKLIIKVSDISNPTKPFEQAKYWGDMLREEMYRQGDKERTELGKVSSYMDRTDPVATAPKFALGFSDMIMLPLVKCLVQFLPKTSSLLESLLHNRDIWVALKDEDEHTVPDA